MITKSSRLDYLDTLKVFLIIMVVFHHAGQAYGDGGLWGYTRSNPAEYSPWLWRFFTVNAAYLMGLFFLISGYFVPASYDRQGPALFLKKKLLRLGIPLAFMVTFLTAYNGFTWVDMGPMWFIEHLLFYCLVYILIRILLTKVKGNQPAKKRPTTPLKFVPWMLAILGAAAVIAAGSWVIRTYSKQDSWIWLFGFLKTEPAHLIQYVTMFILGITAYRLNLLERLSTALGIVCLTIAMTITCLVWVAPTDNAFMMALYQYGVVVESVLCLTMSVGLLWLFREILNFSNPFLKWCSDQAFGVYFFHCVFMVILQTLTDRLYLGGGIEKSIFIGIITLVVSAVITYLLKLIPGVKKVL